MDIPEAAFPVKFLGVPLISSRLNYGDCLVLKERILARIQSWANKSSSYGGRALLIQSVLFNIQVYSSAIFILPQNLVKEIDSILSAFLWKGVELESAGAKVK